MVAYHGSITEQVVLWKSAVSYRGDMKVMWQCQGLITGTGDSVVVMYCTWVRTLLVLALRFAVTASQCGVPGARTKIVGGRDVPTLKYPWYVALVIPSASSTLTVSCGGSLITSRHVLTAAHCFPSNSGRPEQQYRAILGLVNRCNQKNHQQLSISKVNIHPRFNSQTLVADVAVLTLERSVSYTPVCLPPRGSVPSGAAAIIGFGSTQSKSQYPCNIQEAQVSIYSRTECERSGLAAQYSRIPGTVCAGVRSGTVDSCDGDSGGPLLNIGSRGVYVIQGIVSFGEGCARKNIPGVYTQVSTYVDYIESITRSRSG